MIFSLFLNFEDINTGPKKDPEEGNTLFVPLYYPDGGGKVNVELQEEIYMHVYM